LVLFILKCLLKGSNLRPADLFDSATFVLSVTETQ
jgi:hypothetical protein